MEQSQGKLISLGCSSPVCAGGCSWNPWRWGVNEEFRQDSQECCLLTRISGSWVTAGPIWCDLCALPGRTDGDRADPTSEEEEERSLAVGWSSGDTQHLILLKVWRGAWEPHSASRNTWGGHKQDRGDTDPLFGPSVSERQKQSCLAG